MSVTSTHHPFPHLIIFESSPGRQNTSFPFLHPAVCHQTFMSLSLLEDKCTIFQFIWKSFMLCRILLCILIFPNKPRFFFFFLLNCWLLQVLVYIFWYICIVKKYFLWTRHNFHPSVFTVYPCLSALLSDSIFKPRLCSGKPLCPQLVQMVVGTHSEILYARVHPQRPTLFHIRVNFFSQLQQESILDTNQ